MPVGSGVDDETQEAFGSISRFIGALDKIKESAAHELVKGSKARLIQALGQVCRDCVKGELTEPIKETNTSTEQLKLFAASLPDDGPDRKLLLQSAGFVSTVLDASSSLFTWSQIEGDKNALGNECALFALRRMSRCIDNISSLGDEEAVASSAKTTIQCLQAHLDSGVPDDLSTGTIQQAIVKMNEHLVSTISKWKESKAGTQNTKVF